MSDTSGEELKASCQELLREARNGRDAVGSLAENWGGMRNRGCQLRGRGRRAGSLQETSLKPVSPANGQIRYRSPSVAELSAAFPAPTDTGARMKYPGGCQKGRNPLPTSSTCYFRYSSRCQFDACASWWTQEPDATFQNLKNQNLIMSWERDNFVSQNLELEAAKAEAEILMKNYENMLSEMSWWK
ncbi:hypothetical protein J5N97_028526 [Dioscorea zingiberensis]|uniref:Uncharacterized protein n=1 Tax=Dioscorea zingiberensis TaxID=325984 RepID=A0A9D5BZD1_9LILI|nr:hypothetical protein J5N97_028526 [Dioscorea zingiberensis]